MSIPDFDYDLEKMLGQHEYSVSLADARTPEDMISVVSAFKAGQEKERQRIKDELENLYAKHDDAYVVLFKLRKIINND